MHTLAVGLLTDTDLQPSSKLELSNTHRCCVLAERGLLMRSLLMRAPPDVAQWASQCWAASEHPQKAHGACRPWLSNEQTKKKPKIHVSCSRSAAGRC